MSPGKVGNPLVRNISSLYLVQIANYIVPILLLPYLTRTLGLKVYGELATFQAIAAYGLVLTDYGFQLSATRRIATHLEKSEATSSIYANVLCARLILAVMATFFMVLTIKLIPYTHVNISVVGALALLVLSNSITPLWLFQGFQRMILVSSVILASRLLSAGLTVYMVHSYLDMPLVLWAQAIGLFLPALFALWKAQSLVSEHSFPSLDGVIMEFREGWYIFQTAVFSALLTNSGVIILGSIAGSQIAGGYSAVERLAKGVASMLSPVTQAIYPRVSASFAKSFQVGIQDLKKFAVPLILFSVLIGTALGIIAQTGIVAWLLGQGYQAFAGVLTLLAPWIVFGVINNILGIQLLTNMGQSGWYALSFSISTVVAIVLFVFLGRIFSYWGIALGLLVGEVILSLLLFSRVGEKMPGILRRTE